ncbi:MAG: S8 family serine peptidase [Verrucomicrobiae bacterium]|nr:S8 family serine peptidase [Verrucomicrobiae bacterium]
MRGCWILGALAWGMGAAAAREVALFRMPLPMQFTMEAAASAGVRTAGAPRSQVLVAHPGDAPAERWIFTRRIALRLDAGVSLESLLEGTSVTADRSPGSGCHVVEAPDALEAWRMAALWAHHPGVIAVHPVAHPPWTLQDAYAPAPNDEFFRARVANVDGQWYLENRDPETGAALGPDLNVRSAWATTRGAGIIVAVADTGVELDHPDLMASLSGAPHFNFDLGAPDGSAVLSGGLGAHGTSAAGLIAAAANNGLGMSGIAPGAAVASWVIWNSRGQTVTDERLGDVFRHAPESVAVQNHSWGPSGVRQRGPSILEDAGIEAAWRDGRGGRGVVLVRGAGNERANGAQAGDDGFANDPRVVCVAAARRDGRVSSFSEPGACVLVAAPAGDRDEGGLFTTDLQGTAGANFVSFFPPFEHLSDYRWGGLGFTGTSAAAPLVSGTAALVLSVNPELTARDVQQVLLISARQPHPTAPGVAITGAGLRFSHDLGFGLVDAADAVRVARSWSNRPPPVEVLVEANGTDAIPDGGFRVELEPASVGGEPILISGLPGTGVHPEVSTEWLPVVDLGPALEDPPGRLEGHGVLIERGGAPFLDKLNRAAAFGAAFAIVYNADAESVPGGTCPGGDQLCVLAGVDAASIPGIFLRRSDGLALRSSLAGEPNRRARLHLAGASRTFVVSQALQCEAVGLRLRTDHSGRGDLRVTLRSPAGTVSVLQRYNADTGPGPHDWTYWSVQHHFEPSVGQWELRVTDQAPGEGVGNLLDAALILRGIPIEDDDGDGLDDAWERSRLGTLAYGPGDDPDGDGASVLREMLLGTDPIRPPEPTGPDIGFFSPDVLRISWDGRDDIPYRLRGSEDLGPWTWELEVDGRHPVTPAFVPLPFEHRGMFQVLPEVAP